MTVTRPQPEGGAAWRDLTALLDWFRDRGIKTIDLFASSEGEPLYRSPR